MRRSSLLLRLAKSATGQCVRPVACRHESTRHASSAAASTTVENADAIGDDVVTDSSMHEPPLAFTQNKPFDPIAYAQKRRRPPRKAFPPAYDRGPLHPIQPAPPYDPESRQFVPGPFSVPRLEETYHSTLSSDLLSLMYNHYPPGTMPGPLKHERLRSWDDSSPYHKNRPLRGPRGGSSSLPLINRPTTFRNVPVLDKIAVSAFVPRSVENVNAVLVATMAVQAITGVRATLYRAKKSVNEFAHREGEPCGAGVILKGEDMWDFLSKCVEIVMPNIKEYQGVSGKSGDGSGNITWRFTREIVEFFPEIDVNLDAYPPKTLPQIDVTCCTTATNDRDGRLLLSALGVPFYGKHYN